ncbi:MAG: DNA recombination protein RmuC [Lachnospiraceae bacterium]|nr:DNA recombination protein RmuC [Lachnospiraceae bacterium]
METWQVILLFLLLALCLGLLIVLLVRQDAFEREVLRGTDRNQLENEMIRLAQRVDSAASIGAENSASLRQEVSGSLRGMSESLNRTLNESIFRLQISNEQKLERISGTIDEKLGNSLNERLDESFKTVSEQLGSLYKTLGELEALSSGVSDLNRTLSNVKTRGVFGEVQLGRILEETMPSSQYAVNVETKKNSGERVEFAVKFPPAADGGEPVLLPIDAKFPSDMYNRIVDASEARDADALKEAEKELRNRILSEARKIRDKYINPPATTNYAVMFLPTEGLYAEVLRIDGLTEACQGLGVIAAGPTTVTALLNSLSVGFRNAQLSRKSVEIMQLLAAVKNQFGRFGEELDRTERKLEEAQSAALKLRKRTRTMERRMQKIGEIDDEAADRLLGSDEEGEDES